MKYLEIKKYLFCLVAIILLFGSCKKKKSIDDIMFMTKGCYVVNKKGVLGENYIGVGTFKKISKDVLYLKVVLVGFSMSQGCNLKIDESGNNLVGVAGGTQYVIPIPKNENDPIFCNGDILQKTTKCYD